MRRAFVSHSTADDGYVAEMESFLRAAGYDEVFNDVSSIHPDAQFWPRIEKGIADADTLVVVLTAASNASDWVKREVELARRLAKNIIPVWIEECPVPPIFEGHRLIDFRPRTRAERRFDIDRIFKYAPADLLGRDDEKRLLTDAWQRAVRMENGRPRVLTFVALGGDALPRVRANAGRAPARLPAALLAARIQVLRPAPRRPRARRVANPAL